MDRRETARAYYRALDDGDYEALADLLAPEFVHDRPDRTLRGRDRFVQFMRDKRPRSDTTHAVDRVLEPAAGVDAGERSHGAGADGVDGGERSPDPAADGDVGPSERTAVAVQGRLLADGEVLVRFVDAFEFGSAGVTRLTTYTNARERP